MSVPTHSKLLAAICARARGIKLAVGFDIDRKDFLSRYYAHVSAEDLAAQDARNLAVAALDHLRWGTRRLRGTALVRVFNPTPGCEGWSSEHTIIEMVNDDMPFLVDSATMTLSELGHRVHLTIHPLLRVVRSRNGRLRRLAGERDTNTGAVESFIRIEIVRETDTDALRKIEHALHATLHDVRSAVEDWPKMLARLRTSSAELGAGSTASATLIAECRAFLTWLADDHFTLLGYREYALKRGAKADALSVRPGTGLGILRDQHKRFEATRLRGEARREARSNNPLVVSKANAKSTVHRPAQLDYIGVKVFDRNGRPIIERRFLGLFTSVAYNENPRDIPLLRLKVQRLMQRSKLNPRGHRGKALQHILDTFPRDDLFQGSIDDLASIALGILHLQERHQVRLFFRPDAYGRFYSCLVYLPREQYSSRARRRIEQILKAGCRGTSTESEAMVSESALARVQVTVRMPPGQRLIPDTAALQAQIEEAVRTWVDRLRTELLARFDESRALGLLRRFGEHFSAAYQDEITPAQASHDIVELARLVDEGGDLAMRLYRPSGGSNTLGFTTFHRNEAIPLHVAVPMLENMGLKVINERIYSFRFEAHSIWIQDFELQTAAGNAIDAEKVAERFNECFRQVLGQTADNDGFNALILIAGVAWREAALLRAYSKYLLQTGLPFSHTYMREVLVQYPQLCRAIVDLFSAHFDPDLDTRVRNQRATHCDQVIKTELDRAVKLDEDRILRAFVSTVRATLRTNFYQTERGTEKPYFSFKLDPLVISELPKPLPKYEVFVYSRRMEAVHLRCGSIARGGIRWSDRREDFRTEVLGLMKAQRVKNTVIVPDGAKGGFVCKELAELPPESIREEVIACYRTFIRGLLDVTDNIVNGKTVHPERVLVRDGDDPYLVVAADKGTATFSDIANELAAEYGFWLGDAFASGGSAGYDHKKMAITARGAWEAVKRHFREIGMDVQKQPFTVIGVGDMSGDVFGNGMLLSPCIKLVAAFNHQHIFIDPNPDPAVSFKERQRLFALPRSSWADYDRAKISVGGGVFTRQTKSISLPPAARELLDIDTDQVTPPQLIRAILRARVDLWWNGGIGTYVKASDESHVEAADPVNDAVRIDARELRCRVVAEGGNLGLTQRGRVEYALAGGRLNTDFIDNSGGVDSSDREVNIKILLGQAIAKSKLEASRRNRLLASMTAEVAERVLAANYAQTQALSMMEARALERLGEHGRLIRVLETRGLLDRHLEDLPSEEEIELRRKAGRGFSRPELAVILSYSKIELSRSLVASDIPEDRYLATEVESYFPQRLSKRFKNLIAQHRLRREIIAMLIASSMVNRMGPFFVLRAQEETGATVSQIARAYAIVRGIFDIRSIWKGIEQLDSLVETKVQYETMFNLSRGVRHTVYWFLQRHRSSLDIEATVKRFRPVVAQVLRHLAETATGPTALKLEQEAARSERLGLPRPLSVRIAALDFMAQALDIVEVAREHRLPVQDVAHLHFEIGDRLKLDWIRAEIETLHVEGRWRAMARGTLREQLASEQRALVRNVLTRRGRRSASDALKHWLAQTDEKVSGLRQALGEIEAVGETDFATLSVALKEVSRLGTAS